MTLLAGFTALLGRFAGREDVAVGMAIANRTRREVEGLIGFFVNTLVVRTDLSGTPGFAQLVGRVRETALASYAHQDLPFERLVEELQPERDLSRNPLIQVMFGYQNFPRAEAEVRGLTLSLPEEGKVAGGTAKFDLTLFLFEDGDRLPGSARIQQRDLRGGHDAAPAALFREPPRRGRRRPGRRRSPSCRCSARRSGTSSSTSGTTPPRPTPPTRASRSCSRSRCAARRTRPR